jgi:NAD(P)H dehydrogenase (quinone)
VLEVGGTPPEDFETIVRRYVTHSPYAKRSLGLTALAIRNLAKAMLTPAPNVEDLSETLNIPNIVSGRLAADSPSWHGSHKPAGKPRCLAMETPRAGYTFRARH